MYQAYIGRGVAYANLGNYLQAIEDFTQAINLNPTFVLSYYHRGNCYEKIGENKKAQADFKKVAELDTTEKN